MPLRSNPSAFLLLVLWIVSIFLPVARLDDPTSYDEILFGYDILLTGWLDLRWYANIFFLVILHTIRVNGSASGVSLSTLAAILCLLAWWTLNWDGVVESAAGWGTPIVSYFAGYYLRVACMFAVSAWGMLSGVVRYRRYRRIVRMERGAEPPEANANNAL